LPKRRTSLKSVTPVTMSLPENLEDIYLTDVSTCNIFAGLLDDFDHSDETHVPDFLSNERVEGRMQQRFELMCRNRQESITLHRAHGHPNNRTLLLNLEAKGIPHKHLKCYILAVSCDACRAAIGKRDNKTSTVSLSTRKAMAQQKKTGKTQRKHSVQQKSLLQSFPDSTYLNKLDFSPITDTVDPSSTITESLACIHKFTASSDSFDYSSLKPSLTTVIGGDRSVNEDGAFRSLNDPLNGSNLQHDQPNITHSTPNTDL